MHGYDHTIRVQAGWLEARVNPGRAVVSTILLVVTMVLFAVIVFAPVSAGVNEWLDATLRGVLRDLIGTALAAGFLMLAYKCLWFVFVAHAVFVNHLAGRLGYDQLE